MSKNEFNPLEDFAKRGTGFEGGKKRVLKFFQENGNKKDRTKFLKSEFELGGFGFYSEKVNLLTGADTSHKGIRLRYNSVTEFGIEEEYKWEELVDCIDKLIAKGEYLDERI